MVLRPPLSWWTPYTDGVGTGSDDRIVTKYHHYRIVVLKRQNRLDVGTDKPKLKVKMQSVSDDDVRKRRL